MPTSKVIGGLIAAVVLASPIVYFMLAGHPQAQRAGDGALSLAAPLPADVPPGVTLTIGDPLTQKVLQYTGWDRALPFHINWVHIAGGPAVTEAFHARALDIGAAADIPPIHAVWVGIPVKIIAIAQRRDPLNNPVWVMAVGPKSGVRTLGDLRGNRIAFSPGQVQGEVVLRTLREHGLSKSDVTLVEMPSTGADVYINALVAGQIDVAPIANGVAARHFLANFGKDGARLLNHGAFRDDLSDLYVRTETLQDPAKAAALRRYVEVWARAQAWIEAHPEQWADIYYVKDQRLSEDDARYVVRVSGGREIPRDWGPAVVRQQEAIDLLGAETHQKSFPASTLFDRRFEPVASNAFAAAAHP